MTRLPKTGIGRKHFSNGIFVVSGSADVGIVALSLALSPNMKSKGRYAEIAVVNIRPSSKLV